MVGKGEIDVSLDQRMDEVAALSVLSEAQKTALLKRIRQGVKTPNSKPFSSAARWSINVFGFAALNSSVGAPPTGYGATFVSFAGYITRKLRELAAETTEEEFEAELQ